ncbi:MAG TPA: hypothetical protein PLN21_22045 [Gemmatales bacterium]|nr:hypothetical protein [Gemmatales bacterium]
MSLAFCTMTSRSARLLLSEQEKSILIGKVARLLNRFDTLTYPVGLAYRELRVALDSKERELKIMTEHEFRRLYPLLTPINLQSSTATKAA